MDIWTGHLDGTCPGQCPGHVQDIEIFLGHCPVPALLMGTLEVGICTNRTGSRFGSDPNFKFFKKTKKAVELHKI